MVDSSTMVGTGIALLASKDLLNKVLGPTADYVGEEVKHLVERANVNLGTIFKSAERKLGSKVDSPGAVNPRVFKQIWDEGRFIEDELAAEYFGGLLASSRSPDGKNELGLVQPCTAKVYLPEIPTSKVCPREIRLHFRPRSPTTDASRWSEEPAATLLHPARSSIHCSWDERRSCDSWAIATGGRLSGTDKSSS